MVDKKFATEETYFGGREMAMHWRMVGPRNKEGKGN